MVKSNREGLKMSKPPHHSTLLKTMVPDGKKSKKYSFSEMLNARTRYIEHACVLALCQRLS